MESALHVKRSRNHATGDAAAPGLRPSPAHPIVWRAVTRWTRYVPHDLAEDYCRAGWAIADAFDDIPHGAYSVLCAWLCDCRPVEPRIAAGALAQAEGGKDAAGGK